MSHPTTSSRPNNGEKSPAVPRRSAPPARPTRQHWAGACVAPSTSRRASTRPRRRQGATPAWRAVKPQAALFAPGVAGRAGKLFVGDAVVVVNEAVSPPRAYVLFVGQVKAGYASSRNAVAQTIEDHARVFRGSLTIGGREFAMVPPTDLAWVQRAFVGTTRPSGAGQLTGLVEHIDAPLDAKALDDLTQAWLRKIGKVVNLTVGVKGAALRRARAGLSSSRVRFGPARSAPSPAHTRRRRHPSLTPRVDGLPCDDISVGVQRVLDDAFAKRRSPTDRVSALCVGPYRSVVRGRPFASSRSATESCHEGAAAGVRPAQQGAADSLGELADAST